MNPYLTSGPTCVSFSGGRTSGYMLAQILAAHGGTLPPDTHVIFANTGKERPETLDFVHECATRWGVHVRWIEWQREAPRWREVTYQTASRDGRPFSELIAWKSYLPNPVQRLCTQHLKIDAMMRFLRDEIRVGPQYTSVIGIRYDEPRRWRIIGQDSRNRRETKVAPLVTAKVTEDDVMDWWRGQPFDLSLSQGEGNCDLCFLKGAAIKDRIVRQRPDLAEWWAAQENPKEGTRRLWRSTGPTYAQLLDRARRQLPLFPDLGESEPDCACTD
jgi:3'-phosphoadenosine 5'-phosphosulfate sulfotransferase (PAPS reductase)/FAD synthetase